jgi:hypothetical protein
MEKIQNTEKDDSMHLLALVNPNIIYFQEAHGQQQLVNSEQLPTKINHPHGLSMVEVYKKLGFEVGIEDKNDPLFIECKMPEGWKIKPTEHSMWSDLIDNNGSTRASIFYKAAFYDRDAFINFETRFHLEVISHLPQELKGKEVIKKVKVKNPALKKRNVVCDNDCFREYEYYGNNGVITRNVEPTIIQEKLVWESFFKDCYDEYNHTPMYFNIFDKDEVIFSTKDNPLFFKMEYKKEEHRTWWNAFEGLKKQIREEAEKYLAENYPDWQSIFAYWES